MKLVLKLTILGLSIALYSCKNEDASFNDYKYANEEQVVSCGDLDTKLYNEALNTFEADILSFYKNKKTNIKSTYNTFLRDIVYEKIAYQDMVSPHTMKVFEALRKKPELWAGTELNYNAPIYKCLTDNFMAKDFSTTVNSLIETNSMRSDILLPPLQKRIKNIDKDKYLATFIALNMYYSQLVNIDPSLVTEKPVVQEANAAK